MPHINLLPWREQKRQTAKKEFLMLLSVVAIVAMILIGLAHLSVFFMIENQRNINQLLNKGLTDIKNEIAKGDKLVKEKEQLLDQIDEIKMIHKKRLSGIIIFNRMIIAVPDGVQLNRFVRKGDQLEINGSSESNSRVSQLMRNVEKAKQVKKATLSQIESVNQDGTGINQFTINLELIGIPEKKSK